MAARCTTCVLPETIPGIQFDDQGVCDSCREGTQGVDSIDFEGKEEVLIELLDKQRKRRIESGLKYDVLVPVSGGRDSCYTAWRLVTKYDLKVLCVNYRIPFTSHQARENIRNLTEKLNIDLVDFPDRHGLHEKSFKKNIRIWMKNPDLANVNLLCIGCHANMFLEMFNVAKRHNIQTIVVGANPYEITGFKAQAQGVSEIDERGLRKLIGTYAKKILKDRSYIRPINIVSGIRALASLHGDTPYLRLRYRNVRKTALFYYVQYREDEITEALKSVGWKKADDNPSPWRFDCEVDSVKNYIYERLIGATEKDDLFSRYVRAGHMSRDEAIKRLENETVNLEIVERILQHVGVTLSELDEALDRSTSKTT